MSPDTNQSLLTPADAAELPAGRAPVPVWLWVVLSLGLYWGMIYFDEHGSWFSPQVYAPYQSLADLQKCQPAAGSGNLARGRALFHDVCAQCHSDDGNGKPNQAPPFVGSEWVLGSPERMIRIPLAGLSGPIKVKDQDWSLSMPAMGSSFSDDDLAAVLTYMRQSWGNKATEITPDQVKKVRAAVGNRSQPWSAAELNALP
jgi:mono/diheme cytochrome c family protein